ncbi:hypothetical protein QL285_037401 [Trifolium repens]|nr:hypothetical protein QL285_037401 [Trifolium repens]
MNSKWIDNRLVDCEGIGIICYQFYLQSHGQEWVIRRLKYLKERYGFCGANHHYDYCEQFCLKEEKPEVINIDYNFQLKKILDEFLRSSQVAFDGFGVECSNLVEKEIECEKFVEMEMQQHAIVGKEENFLEENSNGMKEPSKVTNVDLSGTPDSQTITIQEKDLLQRKDISNKADAKTKIDKVIDMICALFATIKLNRIWKQHFLFLKFMEFLPNKRKKDDMLFLTYMPP